MNKTRAEVEGMLRKEKERASTTITCLDFKVPYSAEIIVKAYPSGYSLLNFQKFDAEVIRGKMW